MPKRKRNNFSGFTLIELLIVIAILGVLSTFALMSLRGTGEKARDAERKSDLSQYANGLASYASGHKGLYPYNQGWSLSGAELSTTICSAIGITDCPEDPKVSTDPSYQKYMYGVNSQAVTDDPDGSTYVLRATLETKTDGETVYWLVCSTGRRGGLKASDLPDGAPANGICPGSGWLP